MTIALIRIDPPANGGYPISLAVEDANGDWTGTPVCTDTLTLPDCALPSEDPKDHVMENSGDSPLFAEVGRKLLEALSGNEVGARWAELREQAGDDTLRTLIEVTPPELRPVPWELLRPENGVPLFAHRPLPCARALGFDAHAAAPTECWPLLRILVVVGDESEAVAATSEIHGVEDAFARTAQCGLVDIEVLIRPTHAQLVERYEAIRPHVLHIIGHGRSTNGGELKIAQPDGAQEGWAWDAMSMVADLAGWVPRLAIVNACRSADQREGAWQIADALATQLRVPAVIGMQGDVDAQAAAIFGTSLYADLAKGKPVDEAVLLARLAMRWHVGSWERRDPWLPTLTLGAPPDRILPSRGQLDDRRVTGLKKARAFDALGGLVDRSWQRRQLLGAADEDTFARGAVRLVGASKAGKSTLGAWCAATWLLRGFAAAYVDLRRDGYQDSMAVLAAIAEEVHALAPDADAVQAAFDGWLTEVDDLLAPEQRVPVPDVANGRYRRALNRDHGHEELFAVIFGAFRVALSTAAGDGLVLVLDHLEHAEPGHWDAYVRRHLVQPIASQELPVRLVLVMRADDVDARLDRETRDLLTPVEVPPIPAKEFEGLARLYWRARGYKYDPRIPEVFKVLRPPSPWDASMFATLDMMAKSFEFDGEQT